MRATARDTWESLGFSTALWPRLNFQGIPTLSKTTGMHPTPRGDKAIKPGIRNMYVAAETYDHEMSRTLNAHAQLHMQTYQELIPKYKARIHKCMYIHTCMHACKRTHSHCTTFTKQSHCILEKGEQKRGAPFISSSRPMAWRLHRSALEACSKARPCLR